MSVLLIHQLAEAACVQVVVSCQYQVSGVYILQCAVFFQSFLGSKIGFLKTIIAGIQKQHTHCLNVPKYCLYSFTDLRAKDTQRKVNILIKTVFQMLIPKVLTCTAAMGVFLFYILISIF